MEETNKKKENIRALKFFLISASAGIIEVGSFTLMNEVFALQYGFAYLTALVLSVLWNFTINRRYTFKSAANVPEAMLLVFLFYCIFTPLTTIGGSYLTEDVFMKSASSFLQDFGEYITLALTMACNLVSEFFYDKYAIYKGEMDNNKLSEEEKRDASKANRGHHMSVMGIDLIIIGIVAFLYGKLLNTGFEPINISILIAKAPSQPGAIWSVIGPVIVGAGLAIYIINRIKTKKKP